jgi:hypothetical protein
VSKRWIKELHTLPVFHLNRCLTTEYSETTAHFNGNFDTDNQIVAQVRSDLPNALYLKLLKISAVLHWPLENKWIGLAQLRHAFTIKKENVLHSD